MERNNERFPEQEAPRKNTDNAFVQVGEDGRPTLPETDKQAEAPAAGEAPDNDEE